MGKKFYVFRFVKLVVEFAEECYEGKLSNAKREILFDTYNRKYGSIYDRVIYATEKVIGKKITTNIMNNKSNSFKNFMGIINEIESSAKHRKK